METRIALIGIIVENPDSVEQLNHLLHEYGSFIVGRMGIPYEKKNVNINQERSLHSLTLNFLNLLKDRSMANRHSNLMLTT